MSNNGIVLNLEVNAKSFDLLTVRDFIHDDGAGNEAISTMAFVPPYITAGLPQEALNGLEMGGF